MTSGGSDRPILVTGGAGAIGSVLVAALARDGAEVRVIDNLSSGRREHLSHLPKDRMHLRVADLLAPEAWRDDAKGTAEIWHFAANPDIRKGTSEPRTDL